MALRNGLIVAVLFATTVVRATSASAQRQMENLGRGVVAIHQGDGKLYVGWRMLGTRPNEMAVSVVALPAEDDISAEDLDSKRHFVFSYFTGNGEDGLHLAHSTDGYVWKALKGGRSLLKPEAGRDRLMRDPSILQGPDGAFHMVWTVSWGERGVGYASSKDLIHWSKQRYIPVMEHEPGAKNCWAPELFYDDAQRQFLVFWATTIPGRFPETDNQSSRGPPAPGNNHRMYYVTTKDFEAFSETRLFYNRGFNVIDAAVVRDGKRYVMFLKDETNKPLKPQKNIRMALSDRAEGPYGPPSKPITGEYWAEGPSALKIDGKWFVYFDKYRQQRYGLVVSRDLVNWTEESEKLRMPKGVRHGTVLRVAEPVARRLLSLN